jgi:hypothetical protein
MGQQNQQPQRQPDKTGNRSEVQDDEARRNREQQQRGDRDEAQREGDRGSDRQRKDR